MGRHSDIQAFNQLFNEYYSRFVRFAEGYVKDRSVAEDFASEAFTSYWENRERLSTETNLPAYILTIIKNKCLNHLQHQQIRQRVADEMRDHSAWLLQTKISTLEACDPDFLFSGEIQQIIYSTLKQLPKKTRQIFILNRFQGFSYKEVAEKVNLSQKAVEFHISKALSQLRLSLKDFLIVLLFFYFCT